MSARQRILARIAAGLGHGAEAGANGAVDGYIERHPRGPVPRRAPDLVPRFREQAERLSSTVLEVPAPGPAPAAVAAYLAAHGLGTETVCWPDLAGLPWAASGVRAAARPARAGDMVGITGAFCAIAETGTLMLLSGEDTPATVSLLPETHVAVLPAARIVPAMEDAWDLLRAERGVPPRAVNLVSGPSRTADIEQTVTLGAHGPYRMLIVLTGEDFDDV